MKKTVRILALILLILSMAFLVSCVENQPEERTLILDRSSLKLAVGDTYLIGAKLIPQPDDGVMPALTWKSSNNSVATCEDGKIVAVGIGKTNITARIENGPYAVCNVEVIEKADSLYVLEGEELSIDTVANDSHFQSLTYVSSNPEVATVESGNGKIKIRALTTGKTTVILNSGQTAFAYRTVTVLSADTLGVSIEYDELPVRVTYQNGVYTAETEIFDLVIEKDASREFLDAGKVRLTVSFKFKKVADSAGADSNNRAMFLFEVYCNSLNKNVVEEIIMTDYCKIGDEPKEFVCILDALLDTGDGQRSFIFKFSGITED